MSASDFTQWVVDTTQVFETVFASYLPNVSQHPSYLAEAMRYAALGGGKRVRPLLVYAVKDFYLRGLSSSPDPAIHEAFDRCAVGVECIHVYSLVHDDMPCMDNDDLRRGKPTVHKQYDDATALLVGDALQALAFDIISHAPIAAQQVVTLIQTLSVASGFQGMVGGQAIDWDSVSQQRTQAQLEQMHARKTGALLKAAVQLPTILTMPAATVTLAMECYATKMGLAFQVMDDILDVTQTTEVLGKTAGKDAQDNKPTYVSVLGLEQAKKYAYTLYQEAQLALQPFGSQAQRLQQLATFIVERHT